MSEHNTHDFVGHEETDAEVGPLVRFAIFLTVVTLVSAALTVGLYKYLDGASRPRRRRAIRWRWVSSGRCHRRLACRPLRSTT